MTATVPRDVAVQVLRILAGGTGDTSGELRPYRPPPDITEVARAEGRAQGRAEVVAAVDTILSALAPFRGGES